MISVELSRRTLIVQHLRWEILVVKLGQVGKEPHVMEVTEGVEQRLNDLIDQPAGLAARLPDFKAMTASILNAFLNQPFDSTRETKEPLKIAAQTKIAHCVFTPDELHRMTEEVLACELVASVTEDVTAWGAPSRPESAEIAGPVVQARFNYDTASITPPERAYDLIFPDDGPPGWAEISRDVQPDGSASFVVRAPLPVVPGSHTLKLRVTATWGANQTLMEREVAWFVGPDPNDPSEVRRRRPM